MSKKYNIKLKCPNCREPMTLEKINFRFQKQLWDKWGCEGCAHILVLDWRND